MATQCMVQYLKHAVPLPYILAFTNTTNECVHITIILHSTFHTKHMHFNLRPFYVFIDAKPSQSQLHVSFSTYSYTTAHHTSHSSSGIDSMRGITAADWFSAISRDTFRFQFEISVFSTTPTTKHGICGFASRTGTKHRSHALRRIAKSSRPHLAAT